MARCKDSVPQTLCARRVKLNFHQFIHVSQYQHVTIQLHHPIVLHKRKWCEFAPAIIESRVVGVILVHRRKKVFDVLFGNLANVERLVSFFGKGVGVEGNQGIFGSMLLERIVEGEQTGEIFGVGDESCPYLYMSVSALEMEVEK